MKDELIKIKTPRGQRLIGPGQPCFIIAEMSGNHNQSIKRAYEIIDAAVDVGVDAVKLQTYTPDTMTIDCDNKFFKVVVNDAWKGQTLYQLYGTAFTPWEWQAKLKKYGEKKGVIVFSTPFDETAVDFLEELDVELYKVASFEVCDLELLKKIGKTKKPVIISRGLSSFKEIETAVKTLKKAGASHVAVLHCVSSYPATSEQMNLATINDIAKKLNVISGLSDHTLGSIASLISVGLGAKIVEKHFTLKRADGGPDAGFSLEPQEMKQLISDIREAEKAIGKPTYEIGKKEKENLIFRRSLFVVKDTKKGEKFTRDNVRCIRPGYGLEPKHLSDVLGRIAVCGVERGTPLSWKLLK
jgi:pseudaminic acid synthase